MNELNLRYKGDFFIRGQLYFELNLVSKNKMAANSSESELDPRAVRSTYMVTYSQADLNKFPTRESFAKAVVSTFESDGKGNVKPLHWACSLEDHADGGKHYHLALKLSGNKRWNRSKARLMDEYSISVHFSSRHENYYSAYRYATKFDKAAFHSQGHPPLADSRSPRTKLPSKARMAASQEARRQRRESSADSASASTSSATESSKTKSKRRRLSNIEIQKMIVANNIHTDNELWALAKRQSDEGREDFTEAILGKKDAQRESMIVNAWKLEESLSTLEREKSSRMELIKAALDGDCVPRCSKQWIESAKQVIKQNHINIHVFSSALRELLIKGRGKWRNLMIVGPANCGKTFLLLPLTTIFKTFSNPATTTFAWIGVQDSEIIFLNDFRWSSEIIAWKDLLLLLEGQIVRFAAPKSQFARDIVLEKDTPVFATSIAPIMYTGRCTSASSRMEDDMMDSRWRVFELRHQIPQREQKEIPPCGRCFAELVMLGADLE